MTDWLALRDDVPGLQSSVYLNSCSMGLPDHTTLQGLQDYAQAWSTRGAASWYESWLAAHDAWRRVMAGLLNARPEELAWAPSVGAALGTLGSALLRQRLEGETQRNELILGDLEFPAAFAALGRRTGTVTQTARSRDGALDVQAYTELLGPQSEVLVASRVLYSTGALQDVKRLMQATRKSGAFGIVDDYQGLGQFTADVRATGADASVGGALKWMCGGVGSAWLHVRRDRIKELSPLHSGWWANANMFAFDGKFTLWDDARRFEGGEVNVAGLLTSLAAANRFASIGIGRLTRRTQALAQDLRERLTDAGIPFLRLPSRQQSAIVAIPSADAAKDTKRLDDLGIVVDHRHAMLRVSPHYYNTEDDNDRLVCALQATNAQIRTSAKRHA